MKKLSLASLGRNDRELFFALVSKVLNQQTTINKGTS
jgi:hypothetical protein